MAKETKGTGLDAELTRFLLMLSFDEDMRSQYMANPDEVIDNWPSGLDKGVKEALRQRDFESIREALIAQHGSINFVAPRRKRARPAKARAKRSR